MQWIQDAVSSITGGSTSATEPESTSNPDGSLQREGQLSKAQLLTFFKRGEELLRSEQTRRRLKDAKLLNQDVEDLITQMQRELFESQGIAGDHGVDFLGQVSTVYKADNEVMAALLRFVASEEDALDEAEMPAAEYEQKQRLLELAKAHTAQLMAKLDELPVNERQAFLQNQLNVAAQLKQSLSEPEGQADVSRLEQPGSSMSKADQLKFFQDMAR